MVTNKKNIKPKHYDVSIIKNEILNYYNNFKGGAGLISYAEIQRHCENEFLNGRFPYNIKIDYFKKPDRKGRELVDEFNRIKVKQVQISTGSSIDYVDLEDVLEKYGGEKKIILLNQLTPLKRQFETLLSESKKREEKMLLLEERIIALQEELIKSNKHNETMQQTLLEMFLYSRNDNELINLMELGQSRNELVNKALKDIFYSPLSFIEELKKVRNITYTKQGEKVIPINQGNYRPEYDL
jgi:hypothetical protein